MCSGVSGRGLDGGFDEMRPGGEDDGRRAGGPEGVRSRFEGGGGWELTGRSPRGESGPPSAVRVASLTRASGTLPVDAGPPRAVSPIGWAASAP